MNAETFEQLRKYITELREDIMGSKGDAYRNSDDVLANFKRIAASLGLTATEVCLVYFDKHVDSLHTWTKTAALAKRLDNDIDQSSGGESIVGRIADVLNYAELLFGCMVYDFGIDVSVSIARSLVKK